MYEDQVAGIWYLETIGKNRLESLIIPLSSHPFKILPPFLTTHISAGIMKIYNRGKYSDYTEVKITNIMR